MKKYAAEVNDPFITQTLEWSLKVNEDIEKMVFGITPFPFVKECLEKISPEADAMVVSQTPFEALKTGMGREQNRPFSENDSRTGTWYKDRAS